MAQCDIIVIGTSAGGVSALQQLVSGLPANFPAALFVVQHVSPDRVSRLPEILSRAGPLPALHPSDGQPFAHGHIYLAPPNHHMLLDEQDKIILSAGPKENLWRPAIDPLFRSAAASYASRAIGIILSGALDDGVAGLSILKMQGGVAIVQEPSDAIFPSMPELALAAIEEVDYVVPVAAMPKLLTQLVHQPVNQLPVPQMSVSQGAEQSAASLVSPSHNHPEQANAQNLTGFEQEGEISGLVCPECGGALREVTQGKVAGFRCHVGHQFSMFSPMTAQVDATEAAFWHAIRSLKDKATVARRLAERMRQRPTLQDISDEYERQAQEAEKHATILEELLLTGKPIAQAAEPRPSGAVHTDYSAINELQPKDR